MNLYKIQIGILKCIDEETGEILNDELLTELGKNKKQTIENLALYIKNSTSFLNQLKEEIDSLTERRRKLENKINNIESYLKGFLNGENFETSKVQIKHRKSKSVIVNDNFINWALENAPHLLTFKDPTPNKTEIKQLLELGENLEHAKIEERNNMKIK